MASRRPLDYPVFQAFDDNGAPLSSGTVEFFDAGTTDQRNTFSDPELTVTNPNPVTLNSRGEPQSGGGSAINVYLDDEPYKIVLKDSDGATIRTIDNYVMDNTLVDEPVDPTNATDQSTDVFEGTLNRDPSSGEVFVVDFTSANTTTTPTFENTDGTLGALTIKQRDGSALWASALNGVHKLYYDGTDLLVLNPDYERGGVPEHATDSATDTFVSATNTGTPGDGNTITRDFQSANTTTTPTLDAKTMTTRDGSALWANAVSGVHELQYDSGADTYLVLDPIPDIPVSTDLLDEDDMASDSATAVPTQQSVKAYADAGDPTLETPVDATNGGANDLTVIDFLGIKSGAQRIVVSFEEISMDGTDASILIQIGDSGGPETSGYDSKQVLHAGGGNTAQASTTGFNIRCGSSTVIHSGCVVLERLTGNTWNAYGVLSRTDIDATTTVGGVKSLSDELDRIRIITSGTDAFDSGNINITVE